MSSFYRAERELDESYGLQERKASHCSQIAQPHRCKQVDAPAPRIHWLMLAIRLAEECDASGISTASVASMPPPDPKNLPGERVSVRRSVLCLLAALRTCCLTSIDSLVLNAYC